MLSDNCEFRFSGVWERYGAHWLHAVMGVPYMACSYGLCPITAWRPPCGISPLESWWAC